MILLSTRRAVGSMLRLVATELDSAAETVSRAVVSPDTATSEIACCTYDTAADTSVTAVEVTVAGTVAANVAAELLVSIRLPVSLASTVAATTKVAELSCL